MGVVTQLPSGVRENVSDDYVMAVDLGQSQDPTAVAVLRHRQVWYSHYVPDWPLPPGSEHFDVVHLARLPLGLSYVEQVAEVRRLLARPPLAERCDLVIDATGVGRAVGDLFNISGCNPVQVTITAGTEQSRAPGLDRFHVPKGVLISILDARLHTGALRFAAELEEAGAMREELRDFRRKVSAAGRYAYEARVGKHDDLVLAVALALWSVVGRPRASRPVVQWGTHTVDYNFSQDDPRHVRLHPERRRLP